MTHRLRYTGVQATVFQHDAVGYVEPGGEFSVPDDRLLAYMRRADIGHAGDCPAPPCKCGDEPGQKPQEPAGSASGKPRGSRRGVTPNTQFPQD